MIFSSDAPPEGTVRDWLDFRATDSGDEQAFLFTDGASSLSWSELRAHARNIAMQLTSSGVDKSDSVAIMLPNGRDAVIALFGVIYGGFRATVINLAAGDEAIKYALNHSDAKTAFVGSKQAEQFNRVRPANLHVFEPPNKCKATLHEISSKDHALLMYTSGTTGAPKGVVHSNASILAGGWTTAVAHHLTQQDRGFCVLPICHINGLCVTVMSTLVAGGSLAMAPKFSASRFWDDIGQFKATWFSVVPTIISHLLHAPQRPAEPTKSRLRFGRSASSALAPEVQRGFEKLFEIPIIETMGLTETAAQILSNPLPPGTRKIGSPGIGFGNEICVLSPELTQLGINTPGEIAVRGPNVMVEYFQNPTATQNTITQDGWLRTGDLGYVDEEGYIFVTGRLKELIIKGGENIAPREIDDVLYTNSDVVEAAAFSRPHNTYGETVEAAVALKQNSFVDEADLLKLCCAKLGKFKAPDRVHILTELPKGPSGKIQRLRLASILDAGNG